MIIEYDETKTVGGITYPCPRFKTLNKVIMTDSQGIQSELSQFYGDDEHLVGLEDLNEYGWEFLVNKQKYNSQSPLDYLNDKVKILVGPKLTEVNKLRETFFPTMSKLTLDRKITYFGSITVGKQRLVMVNVGPGYDTVKFYDTTISEETPKIVVRFEKSEIAPSKILWFVITSGGKESILDINLSFISWEHSKNPERKQNHYLLRNDDMAKAIADLDMIEKVGSFSIDQASSTILGNLEVPLTNCPLLKSKIEDCKDNKEWDPYITYLQGENCIRAGQEWVSVDKPNQGNVPGLSASWTLSSCFGNEYNMSQAIITVSKNDSSEVLPGHVSPYTITIPKEVGSTRIFDIICKNGYVLNKVINIDTNDSSGYTYSPRINWETYAENNGNQKLVLGQEFMNGASVLDFQFIRDICPIEIYRVIDGVENSIELSSPRHLGKDYVISKILVDPEYRIESIKKEYLVENNFKLDKTVKVPEPYLNDSGDMYIDIPGKADLPATYRYYLYFTTISYEITVKKHTGFFIDNPRIVIPKSESNPNSEYRFRFAPTNGNTGEGIKYSLKIGEQTYGVYILVPGLVSINTDTIEGLEVKMELIDNRYFDLSIKGKVGNNIDLNIWK